MKLYYCLIFIFICIFLIGCSNTNNTSYAINDYVYRELEKIENVESLNEETIKALSIVIRTNIEDEEINKNVNIEKNNSKLYKIINSTNNLKLNKKHKYQKFIFDKNNKKNKNEKWNKSISKSDILKYMLNKNISLANISDIKINYNDENKINSISIAEKNIIIEELIKEFNLPNNNIVDIKINKTNIVVIGEFESNNIYFDIEKANELSNTGLKYNKILEETLKNYEIIDE